MHLPPVLRLALPALLLPLFLGACRVEPVDPSGDRPADVPTARLTGDQEDDRATLGRLYDSARALARTEGCGSAEQCRSAPVGAKPCGGPRLYLPYCPLTTDVGALTRRIAQVDAFERAFNEKYGLGSDCAYVSPPQLELSGGACRAAERRE